MSNAVFGAVAGVVGLGVVTTLGVMAYRSSASADEAKREAEAARRQAEEERREAERQRLFQDKMLGINNRTPAQQQTAQQQTAQQQGGGFGGVANVLLGGAALVTGLGGLAGALGSLFG